METQLPVRKRQKSSISKTETREESSECNSSEDSEESDWSEEFINQPLPANGKRKRCRRDEHYEEDDGEGRSSSSGEGESEPKAPPKHLEKHVKALEGGLVAQEGIGVGWDRVIGLEDIKNYMKLHVIRPMQEPEKFKGLAGPPRGVLFKGPPGCGKTLVAQAVASEVGSGSFIYVSSGQIMSKWYGESEKAVEALFWLARERSPSIIFLDEAESFFPQDSSEMSNRVANVFKVCMDGFMRNREQMVIVVAATNHEELIDQAVLSRLDTRVSFPKPNSALISSLLMRAQCELNGIIVSPGLSDEELVNLLDESGDQDECALEQDVRSIESRVGRFLRKLISLGIRELNEK